MSNTTAKSFMPRLSLRLLTAGALALLMALLGAGSARADLQLDSFGVSIDQPPRIQKEAKLVSEPFPHFEDFPYVKSDGTYVDPEFVRQAGSHPDVTLAFKVHSTNGIFPDEEAKDVEVDLPKGLVGNPTAIPSCLPEELLNVGVGGARCPLASQVGVAELVTRGNGGTFQVFRVGIFNIAHGPNTPARFGFNVLNVVSMITARVRPGDFGISSGSFSISQAYAVESVRIRLWGVPADPGHDWERASPAYNGFTEMMSFDTPRYPGRIQNPLPRVPFLTLPPACPGEPLAFTVRANSWENPDAYDSRTVTSDDAGVPFTMERCDRLGFSSKVDVRPLSHTADSPTGVDVDVNVPQPQDPDGLATPHVRKVKMTFPKGVSVSPSSAAGLDACTPAQIGLGNDSAPSCPQSSVIGKVSVETPLLENPLEGDMILATPFDNPFDSLIALYISVEGSGVRLKLPGKVDLDPVTGQVTATFDENPQQPFSNLHVEFPGGSTASLATPPSCGAYDSVTELTSWASPVPVDLTSPMAVDQGCDRGPNAPSFTAGTNTPLAGKYAPFDFHATRADRTPYLSRIVTSLPPGLLANIGSVTKCGEADANAGTCPAASRVGSTSTLVGPGAQPLPAKGDVYLTGPYKGAEFGMSIAVPTKGQAGPFDLGTVVVRAGIYVDPIDAHVTVKSDPLPTIVKGIPLRMRQVNLEIDRDQFTINPTNCDPKTVSASFDALGAPTSNQTLPFQVAGCKELGFKPKLALKFTGPTHRTGHPALKATLKMPKGGSNISKAVVTLPKTEFLENAHIRTICTRVQYAADNCPKGSVYGYAKAWTPLLDEPLQGPVYLRSSDHTLPDLVASLDGAIHVDLAGRIDSPGGRIRNTFWAVPDAPVSKFVLTMKGGAKGLLVNNEELCRVRPRARAEFTGQNGKSSVSNPRVKLGCGKSSKKRK